MVSAVGIGAGGVDDPGLIIRAVDAGLNYIDTSVCYGDSELVIARALAERPDLRDKLYIATKWDVTQGMDKARILTTLDRSLERLGVAYVDIMQLHWLGGGHVSGDDGFNRLDNPALYEAMAEAKRAGKVRWFGATSHDKKRSAILQHAIDKGAADMILVKLNVIDNEDADMPALLAKAKAKDVGVVLMKTQPSGGERPKGFEDQRWSLYQANLRWALSQGVACVVHSGIGDDADTQDAAIAAARSELSHDDRRLLEGYATAMSPHYCRGCDDICGAACPEGIAIAAVVQLAMYDRAYGWRERARRHYRHLPVAARWSERCASCDACSAACPYGFDAATRVRDAHASLDAASAGERA
jgi:predicted aldo/keto reductase-like oxidoreductase